MLAAMPAHIWWEWIALHKIDPMTEERADYRAGVIAATVANANRDKKRRHVAYKPRDFMASYGRPRRQSVEEMIRIAEEITRSMGGQDLRPH